MAATYNYGTSGAQELLNYQNTLAFTSESRVLMFNIGRRMAVLT